MNSTEMLNLIRTDLGDTNPAAYRWEDAALARHLSRAVGEYSMAAPREMTMSFITVLGERNIDLTPIQDRVCLTAAEYPAGEYPRRFRRFSAWGHRLTLEGDPPPDGSELLVYYGAMHTLDTAGCTIPAKHHDLVAGGAAAYAALEWSCIAVNRVNSGADAAEGYFRWAKERLSAFQFALRRLKLGGQVRAARLYHCAANTED